MILMGYLIYDISTIWTPIYRVHNSSNFLTIFLTSNISLSISLRARCQWVPLSIGGQFAPLLPAFVWAYHQLHSSPLLLLSLPSVPVSAESGCGPRLRASSRRQGSPTWPRWGRSCPPETLVSEDEPRDVQHPAVNPAVVLIRAV